MISRRHPEKLRAEILSPDVRFGWLAEAPGNDHFSANAMGHLAKTIQQFILEHGSSGLVLIDGLEYVIVHNGFQATLLAFVEHLNEFVMGTQAIVLIAFRAETLDARELALLERNLSVLDGKDVRAQLDMEELGEILGRETERAPARPTPEEAPKVLNPGPGMRGNGVPMIRCARCGTENADDIAFCVYCGASLTEKAMAAPPPARPAARSSLNVPPSAIKKIPPAEPRTPERQPDFVGLIGIAFFFLTVGIVFTLNANLLNDMRTWWDSLVANGLFVRPPDGIITSGILFTALLALSNYLTSGLRWILDRNRFGALARVFAGIAFVSLAALLWRYSLRAVSGQLVISIWTAILGGLLVVYIAIGLYWSTARRRRAPAPIAQPPSASKP
ncbi:MAG: DUF835 domain-containing protein [Thermoplasmata archaeon]|nr:DUF835 domain-containing protein [Thermoplasmata archaeon]